MRILLRPTVASDLAAVIALPLPHRVRAITALRGDEVLGVGGIGYRPDGTVIGFAAISDELRKYPAAIHRAGLMGMAMIRQSGVGLVVAEAQAGNAAAEPWLLRLGFVAREISGLRAFVWERPNDVE